jgi:mono/diheme cytochrome c family protein
VTAEITVYLFLAATCPLSIRLLPEIERIKSDYAPRGVRFETGDAARAKKLGARVTPQVVVTDVRGRILYRGRIDDRSPAPGIYRAPSKHDLRDALDALLSGKPAPAFETRATGCAIALDPPGRRSTVTFSKQIAPIVFRHCVECHRPDGSAPFALGSYADAAPRASALAQVARARLMPPWKAEPGPHPFEGAARLDESEIRLLETWAREGAPEGDPSAAPPVPQFTSRWELGAPDMVIRMPAPFNVPASSPDLYRCIVVPLKLASDRYVRAYDFRPGNRRLVHHALIFVDALHAARKNGETYPCFGVPGFLPSAAIGGWTPGFTATRYPPQTAVRLRSDADLVFQIHYHPDAVDASDQSELALYLTPDAPKRRMMEVALGSRDLDIQPGQRRYVVRDRFELPVDVEVTGIIPHAHYICRTMTGRAVLPDGKRVDLIRIEDWDFNWQRHYRYARPFVLPAGTRLEMEFVYDNSSANPRNPSAPPRRVQWGPGSTDEMAGLHVQVIPLRDDDAAELGQALWGKIMRAIRETPGVKPVPR